MNAKLLIQHPRAEVWRADALNPESVSDVVRASRLGSIDAAIFDAPYSEKTHEGHSAGKLTCDRAASYAAAHADHPTSRYAARKSAAGESGRRDLDYAALAPSDVESCVAIWHPHVRGWIVSITDNVLAPAWSSALSNVKRYVFAPLPLVETGSRVRMGGDGPSNWTCWCVVARPRSVSFARWGTLRGAYVQPAERSASSKDGSDRIVGGKPLLSMMQIVEDYSRPDDLVCDMFAGAGTSAVAALRTGRRALAIELNEERARLTADRVRCELNLTTTVALRNKQPGLFDGAT